MRILYIHGFGSKFDDTNDKVVALGRIGYVVGIDIDYTLSPDVIHSKIFERVIADRIDLIVGTSMGGHFAARVGASAGVPFVACNPSIDPATALLERVGTHTDYYGREYTLTEEVVKMYKPFATNGCGLILLDDADELFDSKETMKKLGAFYDVRMYGGGSHRFEHMDEAIAAIDSFYDDAELVYGL